MIEWVLKPIPNHTSYLAHYARQRLLLMAKPGNQTIVGVDQNGQIAGIVTYYELKNFDLAQKPSLLERIAYWSEWIKYQTITLWNRIVNGEDYRAADANLALISESCKKVFLENKGHPGVSHFNYVGWVGVDPKYQGQGLGAKLVDHGIELGLPLYLEASALGHPMYLKKGYKELGPKCYMRDVDGRIIETTPTMLHPGKAKVL